MSETSMIGYWFSAKDCVLQHEDGDGDCPCKDGRAWAHSAKIKTLYEAFKKETENV